MTQIIKPDTSSRADKFLGVSLQIMGIVFLGRFIIDIGTRMIFPFIPQLSQGLGLSIVAFSGLIFVRTMAGITGPVFGILSDHHGRRKLMVIGLLCQAIGVFGLATFEQQGAILSMIFFGLGLAAFLPAQQAYISDQVPYQKRGRALATVEISWASVAIFILPIIGWMIDTFGWRSPFFVVALLSLAASLIVWLRLPPVEHRSEARLSWAQVQAICFRANVLAAITVELLLFVAVGIFIGVWGIWLTADFALDAVALGLIATSIGVAELGGSVLSSLFIDRIGKQLGSGLGLLLGAFVLLLLPLTQSYFFGAVAGLIAVGFLLEVAIVSLIPIFSEQAPEARGTALALILSGAAIGGAIGTPIAAILWEQSGLGAVCAVAVTCLFIAFGLTRKFLREAG